MREDDFTQGEVCWVRLLVKRAKALDDVLHQMDGQAQAALLREMFRKSDMVCALWWDQRAIEMHRYIIIKHPPTVMRVRYLSGRAHIGLTAVLLDCKTEALLLKGLYDLEMEHPNDGDIRDYCSVMWMSMVPASWDEFRSRVADAFDR